MRTIKLMADYQCYPLWEASPGVVGNIDPGELPISSALRRRLMAWASTFDATLNMDDPASSGFPTDQAAEEFKKEGLELAQQLQDGLGATYIVIHKL